MFTISVAELLSAAPPAPPPGRRARAAAHLFEDGAAGGRDLGRDRGAAGDIARHVQVIDAVEPKERRIGHRRQQVVLQRVAHVGLAGDAVEVHLGIARRREQQYAGGHAADDYRVAIERIARLGRRHFQAAGERGGDACARRRRGGGGGALQVRLRGCGWAGGAARRDEGAGT
jgi:hypothetical protein